MTISQLIAQLQAYEDKHGDVYVEVSTGHLVQSAEPMRIEGAAAVVAIRIK